MFNKKKWNNIRRLQKGTHLMSRVHRPFEDLAVYLLYDLEFIGADLISLVTYALAFLAAYLMVAGELVLALSLMVLVGVLDGVDGKVARLRGKKTLIGKLEHSFDMLFEQVWYVAFTWYIWQATGSNAFLVLGFLWLVLDGFVRHIYNVTWIATGKSLKYHGGLARYVTFIDGRRSVYVTHMIIWFFLGSPSNAMYTILGHCALTAISYTFLAFKATHE
ncbi:MAG: CDP-alcohol phosphatidyltransferase family protein [Candidatus Hydrothermarchaeota archaeon]|jgi:phosphatidylserine synthase|nr:CDP-alcohol phosphatidyltransferase family protein [Candidatus Hydrothermarchaeota archaeon]